MRIWRIEPPSDGDEDGGKYRESWKGEIVGEFGKGSARIGMVEVSQLGRSCSGTFEQQHMTDMKLTNSGTRLVRH